MTYDKSELDAHRKLLDDLVQMIETEYENSHVKKLNNMQAMLEAWWNDPKTDQHDVDVMDIIIAANQLIDTKRDELLAESQHVKKPAVKEPNIGSGKVEALRAKLEKAIVPTVGLTRDESAARATGEIQKKRQAPNYKREVPPPPPPKSKAQVIKNVQNTSGVVAVPGSGDAELQEKLKKRLKKLQDGNENTNPNSNPKHSSN